MAQPVGYAEFFVAAGMRQGACELLNQFLISHRVVQVHKEFVNSGSQVGWHFLIEYLIHGNNNGAVNESRQVRNRIDYREKLSPEEFAVFDRLRTLRKEVAEQHGVPVYAVFTNEQLADMVALKPVTLGELKKVAGIGEGKAAQYGAVFTGFFEKSNKKDSRSEEQA